MSTPPAIDMVRAHVGEIRRLVQKMTTEQLQLSRMLIGRYCISKNQSTRYRIALVTFSPTTGQPTIFGTQQNRRTKHNLGGIDDIELTSS